ncbi:MAG: F0F1 ATP synthase subunit A [Deferrisomatales bacterium]|nr:F0F1 ATP synthase subunit A [Deferrisomatales bacterium]
MEAITHIPHWVLPFAGRDVVLNATTLLMSWVVMAVLVALGMAVSRRPTLVPGALQSLAEVVVGGFRDLVRETLGKRGPRYYPLVLTLFIFILISNWLGMIPFLQEPTKDLNTTLILALIAFLTAQAAAVKAKGWRAYLKEYFQPFFFMFPLNVIGEAAKVVSMSFRLYGNVMGGSIIILVVSHLVHHLIFPPLLSAFFGLFVGTVQAFVFAMLTLTYISVALQE